MVMGETGGGNGGFIAFGPQAFGRATGGGFMPSGDQMERERQLWEEEGEGEEGAVRRKEVHWVGMVGCYLSIVFPLGLMAKEIEARGREMLGCRGLAFSAPAVSFSRAYL